MNLKGNRKSTWKKLEGRRSGKNTVNIVLMYEIPKNWNFKVLNVGKRCNQAIHRKS